MEVQFTAMNSTIKVAGIEPQTIEKIKNLFFRFEQTASRFIPGNPLFHVNESPIDVPIHIEESLDHLLEKSMRLSRKVDYLVNPFMGEAMKSIGYTSSFHPEYQPNDAGFSSDWKMEEEPFERIAKQWMMKKRNFTFDFGGFGKGYIVDEAKKLLVEEGVTNALVNAGGDLAVIGCRRVGIEHPELLGTDMIQFQLTNGSLATSGKNIRKWRANGKNYHHLLNGQTGKLAENGVLQASVVARTTMEAEILSKIFCILPFEEAKAFLYKKFPQLAYFVYFENGSLVMGGDRTLIKNLEVAS